MITRNKAELRKLAARRISTRVKRERRTTTMHVYCEFSTASSPPAFFQTLMILASNMFTAPEICPRSHSIMSC
jgi:hypothetical protein